MEVEAGGAPGPYRNPMMSRVRSYKRDFEKLRKDLVRNTVALQTRTTSNRNHFQ